MLDPSTCAIRRPCWGYARVSTDDQAKHGIGLDVQDKAQIKCLVANSGWYLEGTIRDLGVSAYRGKNITEGGLGEFLKRVKQKKIKPGTVLIVYSLDRLTRQKIIKAQKLLLDILDEGISIYTTIDEQLIDPDADDIAIKLLMALLVMEQANKASANKSTTHKNNWEEKRGAARENGKRMTRLMPGWLDRDDSTYVDHKGKIRVSREPIVNEDNKVTVNRIFELSAEGHGYAGVFHRIVAEGRKPFKALGERDAKWSIAYVRKILHDRAVLGETQHNTCNHDTNNRPVPKGEPLPNYYPVYVEQELWDRAHHEMAKRFAATPTVKPRSGRTNNLFGGLCRCLGCGGNMTWHKPKAYPFLRCYSKYIEKRDCPTGANYQYAKFEKAALDLLCPFLADDEHNAEGETAKLDREIIALKDELADAERRHNRLYDLVEQGNDDPMLFNRLAERQNKIANLKDEIAKLERSKLIAKRPDRMSIDVARDLIHRAENGDQDARAKLAAEMRQIIPAVGFAADGLVIIAADHGKRFWGIRRGKAEWLIQHDGSTDRRSAIIRLPIAQPEEDPVTKAISFKPFVKGDQAEAIYKEVAGMLRVITDKGSSNKFAERWHAYALTLLGKIDRGEEWN